MTLTNSRRFQPVPVAGTFPNKAHIEGGDDTAVALSMYFKGPNADWSYSETAEGLTGETAVSGIDLDESPGLIYAGRAGAGVTVSFKDLDIQGSLFNTPEATDEITVVILKNNTLVGYADEGLVSEFDTATVEFNGAAYLDNMQAGDVIRIALKSQEGNEASLDFDVVENGVINIE